MAGIKAAEAAGAEGAVAAVAAQEHQDSMGLVDGKWHRVAGKRVRDRARRSAAEDKAAADEVVESLMEQFKLLSMSAADIAALGYNEESYARFKVMQSVPQVECVVKPEYNTDFLTTVRSPSV